MDWNEIWKTSEPLGVAFLLSVFIGWDREREEHYTGVRTFPIVAVASCAYVLIFGGPGGDTAAQSRVLQGVVTGIGFVGAGAILKNGSTVHGTATAASIWNAGAIGAAAALGKYPIAIILTLLNLFTLKALLPLKNRLAGPAPSASGNEPAPPDAKSLR